MVCKVSGALLSVLRFLALLMCSSHLTGRLASKSSRNALARLSGRAKNVSSLESVRKLVQKHDGPILEFQKRTSHKEVRSYLASIV